uniref:DUF1707 and DUF2154 domain-containing protein n=1 Tax=Ningiella ruwaisensis TaxID=2364274 RepID=UPI0010A024B7|nr:DUF1707 and DUF2154 domain-containing protein [Ningiella ruwaisensis]
MKSQVKLEDRPIEQVREETIDTLIYNYSHAVISEEAFERRLDIATESTSHAEIVDQVSDLSPPEDDTIAQHKARQFDVQYDTSAESDDETLVSVLSSNTKGGHWVVPKEITCYSILGSIKLDFSNAVFSSPNVTIKVVSILSGDKFYVPESVNVTSSVINVLSGVSDHTASMAGKQAPKIKIEGVALLSDISVSVKKTMKEKFVSFANQMKAMFSDTQVK